MVKNWKPEKKEGEYILDTEKFGSLWLSDKAVKRGIKNTKIEIDEKDALWLQWVSKSQAERNFILRTDIIDH